LALDPRFLATAVDAALEAGRIHRSYFRGTPEIHKKGPIDLVTTSDVEAERAIRASIERRFPAHRVLGEEDGAGASPVTGSHRWIVDPLDGTTNFAHGLALFCVSIGLEIDGRMMVGVVYDPMAGELFTAERGEGARCNGQRLAVSTTSTLIAALLCTGFPYTVQEDRGPQVRLFEAFLRRARAVRRLGSAALDLSYVAAGRLDGFWEDRLHAWDVAAGGLIVEEAGGRVTDYDDRPVDLTVGQIITAGPALHGALLEVVRTSGLHRGQP
jgi:myo-inositol-1(or 4)-monophosphatase